MKKKINFLKHTQGFSMLEMLVVIVLSSLLFSSIYMLFMNTTEISLDAEIQSQTDQDARALLDMILFDLRMAGAGVPFAQDDFEIGDSGLGDAPLPILLDSDGDFLHFRFSDDGYDTFLSSELNTATGGVSFNVANATGFKEGDIVYITNFPLGYDDGLKGTIDSITLNSITLDADYTATSNAVFGSGSIITKVIEVTYDSPADWSGITRDDGSEELLLMPKSKFSVKYLDSDYNEITLPLTESKVANDLYAIEVTINVRSSRSLTSGALYEAEAKSKVALRNLILSRQ